jgi:predicted dehydrogenase
MAPVRIGFVGGGEHARMSLLPSIRHALGGTPEGLPALVATHAGAQLPPLLGELVALAEHKRGHAERIAAFHGIPNIYSDHEEMLAHEDLDCVIVCLHPRLQPDVAIACLDAGAHVFVEKPQAETVADSLRIRAAAERNGKQVAVAFMKRYSEPYLRARQIAQLADFGPPSFYEARFTYAQYPVDVYNFLNGFGIHHLDLPRFFMGEIDSVYADRVSRGAGLDGYAITLRFASGALGLVNINCLESTFTNWSERLSISGVGSSVHVENWRRVIAFVAGESEMRYWEPEDIQPTDAANSLNLHGFVGEIRDFVASVAAGRKPLATLHDGIEAMRLQEAIERSVATGQRVQLTEVAT